MMLLYFAQKTFCTLFRKVVIACHCLAETTRVQGAENSVFPMKQQLITALAEVAMPRKNALPAKALDTHTGTPKFNAPNAAALDANLHTKQFHTPRGDQCIAPFSCKKFRFRLY